MKGTLVTLAIACALASAALAAGRPDKGDQQQRSQQQQWQGRKQLTRRVDLVIALDTSGSMDGLINAARQKLWDVVNEVARVRPAPVLRVGLVTFGSQGTEQDGYVKVRSDLTTDLDTIYSKLFELTTWGGTEYVGRAVQRATSELSWDDSPTTLKQIFVAGNESADQDRVVRSARSARRARRRGIFVNAIYCGSPGGSEAAGWQQVAQIGGGLFASIDHDHGTVNVVTPYDRRLAELSNKLNGTYVGYGKGGAMRKAMQSKQDQNAASVHSGVAAARAKAKASGVYRNAEWDLVDARKEGKLGSIGQGALPAELRKLGKKELDTYLEKQQQQRKQLQAQIVELSKKRQAFVAAELKKRGTKTDKAFDTALKRGIELQAKQKGFSL